MRAGGIAMLCLADVPDSPILGRNAQNVLTVLRTPEPGFLWNVHLDRLAWVDELIANHGIRRVLTMADALAAHQSGQPAIIMDIEGLDFLERKLERLEVSYQRGVRTMQRVHYTPNDIGDFQTGMVTHHGLTAFGAEVIRACHTLGVVVDVAHGTEDMVKQALQVATKPLLLSHTALRGSRAQGPTPLTERQITPSHARAIAENGGTIGIWHFFPTLEKYIEGVKGSCTSWLRIIARPQKSGKIPPLHHHVRGHDHDSVPILLPTRDLGTPLALCHDALWLARPMRRIPSEVSRA
jgi:membrane dipeptidase